MKKNILKSNGEVISMTFEEVMDSYKGLIVKVAKTYKGMFLTEDDMQEGYLGLWKAFSSYDEQHCFSTHAMWMVRQRFAHLKKIETSPKRDTRGKDIIHMEFDLGDGNELGDMLEDLESQFEQSIIDRDVIQYIKNNLSPIEMDLLAFNLGYVQAIEIAHKYNTTKSNISNKNAAFKAKLKKLIQKYNEF